MRGLKAALALMVISVWGNSGSVTAAADDLRADQLYRGWQVSHILGKKLVSKSGRDLGVIRNLMLTGNGQIRAALVETPRRPREIEYMSRIPWDVVASELPDRIVADIPIGSERSFPLFGSAATAQMAGEFPVTEIIGDYARLRTGRGYGYVSDAVFAGEGLLIAILVTRDTSAGGGKMAFAFPGRTGRWDPQVSYYGLPYVTPEQADAAGLQVDGERFSGRGNVGVGGKESEPGVR